MPLAHIGVIEELKKNSFEITSLAGSSIGVLMGGLYTLGKIKEFANWMMTMDRRKVFQLVNFTLKYAWDCKKGWDTAKNEGVYSR